MKQKSSLFIIMLIATVFFNSCDESLGNNSPSLDCSDFKITGNTYAETEDLIQKVQDEYGSDYTIADWSDLKAIDDLSDWISLLTLNPGVLPQTGWSMQASIINYSWDPGTA